MWILILKKTNNYQRVLGIVAKMTSYNTDTNEDYEPLFAHDASNNSEITDYESSNTPEYHQNGHLHDGRCEKDPPQKFQVYARRWYIMVMFGIMTFVQVREFTIHM